jgi:hypothetical protein
MGWNRIGTLTGGPGLVKPNSLLPDIRPVFHPDGAIDFAPVLCEISTGVCAADRMGAKPLKILYLSSEVTPFAKTGGLADVAGAWPGALQQRGHEVAVFMPRYGSLSQGAYRIVPTGVEFVVPIGEKSMSCKIEKTFLPESRVRSF